MANPFDRFDEIEAVEVSEDVTPNPFDVHDVGYEAPPAPIPEEASPIEKADAYLRQALPAWVPELASSMNRPILETIDTLGVDTINALSSLVGSEARVPSLMESVPGAEGGFMEEGTARDIVQATGETATLGGLTSQGLKQVATRGPQVLQKYLAPLATTRPASEVALGGVSGAGAEYGEQEAGTAGQLIGGILAPTAASVGAQPVKGLINMGARGIQQLTTSLSKMSDDAAAKLLADAMMREGLSPDDVAQQLAMMGDEAMPADLGANFNSLLRSAANKVPRIAGRASAQMSERQAGQSERLLSAFDDASGTAALNVDDEIIRLNETMTPEVSGLYDTARNTGFNISEKLQGVLDGKNSLATAFKKAQRNLRDVEVTGEAITPFDLVDETKRVLDDRIGSSIRKGNNNEAMRLLKLKKSLVSEVDASNPAYKEARDAFAGKAELENAASRGEDFFKLKAREVKDLFDSMSESEKRFFKLGAKQAVMDKVETLQDNANAVKRIFGKSGDIKKLREVFDSDEAFNQFADVLERESKFVVTKNATTGNSTTVKQALDFANTGKAVKSARDFALSPEAETIKIMSDLKGKKGDLIVDEALEKVGDILLESGIDSQRVVNILRRGSQKEIERLLNQAAPKLKGYESEIMIPTGKAFTAETVQEITE